MDNNSPRPARAPSWITVSAWMGAAFYAVTGLWALAAPSSFHRIVAPFDPLNQHYLRDSGAFALGMAAVLFISLTADRRALSTALLGVGTGSFAHGVAHVVDVAAGGRPAFDIPSLGVLGILLIAAGWSLRRRDS